MDDKLDKSTDKLVQKAMQYVELPKPSSNFTLNLMHKIEALKIKKTIIFKSLISKKTWFVIFFLVLGMVTYSFYETKTVSTTLLDIEKINAFIRPKLEISSTITNSIVIIGVILMIQLIVLKKYFEKNTTY